jgi:hypothetical protein
MMKGKQVKVLYPPHSLFRYHAECIHLLTPVVESLPHWRFWSRPFLTKLSEEFSRRIYQEGQSVLPDSADTIKSENLVCILLLSRLFANTCESVTAVSCGSVLRGANLNGGPEREAYSSYGFLRNELYNPTKFIGHRNAETFLDPCDGELYVKVIHYFIHHVSPSLLDAQEKLN